MLSDWHSSCRRLLLLAILVCAFPLDLFAQQKPVVKIGVLVDLFTAESEVLRNDLQAEVLAVVGEDATVEFPEEYILTNFLNPEDAERNYQTLLDSDVDIILAFGPLNNQILSGKTEYPKPTILFGTVNLDLIDFDITVSTSGIPNFNYLITSQSYRLDIETFKSLYNFSHLGILITSELFDIIAIEEVFSILASEMNFEYTLIPYDTPDSLVPYEGEIDAVYLAEGFFLDAAEITALADWLYEKRLPSFTSTFKEDVERGLMATFQADENLDLFFRRLALNIEAVVNGAKLEELPLFLETEPFLTINYNTAERVGVPIKYSLVATTQFVGDFKNVISEKTYSLLDVMQEVLDRNLALELSRKNVDLADQDVRTAQSNYLPNVSASASGSYVDEETAELSNGQNPEYSASGSVTVTQTVFSEAANANISIQKSLSAAERADYSATELDLILNGATAYFNALILKANLEIQSENLDVTRQNLQIAEQNFEAGQSGRSDILRFRSEMAQNMQALVEAVNQLELAFFSLNELLNHPIDREIDIEEAEISEGIFEDYDYQFFQEFLDDPTVASIFVDFLVSEAIKNAPELKSIQYNIAATDRNILLNGGRRFIPTVALQAQYNRTFDQWGVGVPLPEFFLRDNFSVGVNVSVPIFDQNRFNINRQTAILQKEQLELNEQNTTQAIEQDVREFTLELINQVTNIQLSEVSLQSARESLELLQAAYASGSATLVQLLDAQNNFVQAQLARDNASYNYLLTTLILERYIGHYFLLSSDQENDAFMDRFLEYMTTYQE